MQKMHAIFIADVSWLYQEQMFEKVEHKLVSIQIYHMIDMLHAIDFMTHLQI